MSAGLKVAAFAGIAAGGVVSILEMALFGLLQAPGGPNATQIISGVGVSAIVAAGVAWGVNKARVDALEKQVEKKVDRDVLDRVEQVVASVDRKVDSIIAHLLDGKP